MQKLDSIIEHQFKNSVAAVAIYGADPLSQIGYTSVPSFIITTGLISSNAKLVYICLLSYAWKKKTTVFPKQSTIASRIGLKLTATKEALRELKMKEFIFSIRRGNTKSNIYVLNFTVASSIKAQNKAKISDSRPATNLIANPQLT